MRFCNLIKSSLLFSILPHVSYADISAKDTELWAPEPRAVTPTPIPSDALILFSGEHTDAWQHNDGESAQWAVAKGELSPKAGTKSIQTKENFCDIQLHLEFKTPPLIKGEYAQRQGNSGIYIQGRYELQVLNSFNNPTYVNGQAGAIYKQSPPLVNASLPPGEWQSYDIIFHAPRFNKDNHLIQPAKLTALHNGVLIQDGFELRGRTVNVGIPSYSAHGCAPIVLQNHGQQIYFRNIWVRRLD